MSRLGVAGAVGMLLALAACGSNQEHEKRQKELAAAEKKVADTQAFSEDLARDKKLLAAKLSEAEAKLAEARGAYHGTLAAAAYLAQRGNGLTLDADMNAARDGFELAQAAKQQDGKTLDTLAASVLDDVRPCAKKEDAGDDDASPCGHCSVAPFEDACEGVDANLLSSLEWSCASLARTGQGVPPAAFCTSTVEHPAPGNGVTSPYSEQALPTSLQLVRIAFAHEGRLYVSDYPKPDPDLYNPPNVEPLVQCKAETERNSCIHDCEVRYDRYNDPCACADDAEPDESEGDDMDDDDDVSREVRDARRAAAAAQAEADAAQKRADEAKKDADYQECLTGCEPERASAEESSNSDDTAEPHVEPVSTTVAANLEATPAPGVFVVSRVVRSLGPKNETVDEQKQTLVLKHAGLVALWRKKSLPDSAELGALQEVGQLDVVLSEAGKPSLAPLPGTQEPVLVGLSGGKVKAYAFKSQPDQEPVTELEPGAACAALRSDAKRLTEPVKKACDELSPPATGEQAGANAGAQTPAGNAGAEGEVKP